MGRALAALAPDHQVLVVTHLPQVAAFALRQLVVRKATDADRTVAVVDRVEGPDRVIELARMLSGNPGSDTAVSEDWAAGSRNFCNKLWNATRFALLNGAGGKPPVEGDLSVADRWILSRLSSVIAEVDGLLERFEFGKACEALYHFAWDELCDWYLELAKAPLASGDEASADRTRGVLGFVLDQTLRLLHPVMPFVTDELWCALTGEDSVMMAGWPTYSQACPTSRRRQSAWSSCTNRADLRRWTCSITNPRSRSLPEANCRTASAWASASQA